VEKVTGDNHEYVGRMT